ncbi:MAG: hypothetical protein GY760_15955 [Deltaproteobacteria bacterium]|nr:hypothetical protein [Deltaproteobacteria bacterium]
MTSCLQITNATIENINCVSSCDSGFLIPPDTTNPLTQERISKCSIKKYGPVDTTTSFDIIFTLDNGTTVVWSFTNNVARDECLAKLDEELNAKKM